MTHLAWLRRRLARSVRVRVGALMLALIVMPAIFAELIAADAPVVAVGPSGVTLLPAVVMPDSHRGLTREQIAAHHADDLTVWPLVRHGPSSVSDVGPNAEGSWRHPLGTDLRGRDLLARLIYGGRAAFALAFLALALSLVFGVILGGLAGYIGGFWDEVLSRPIELIDAFPTVIVVAIVRAIYPDGTLWSLVFAVAAVRWAEVARLVRAEVVKLSAGDFVVAARAIGCTHTRILRRHILPHTLRPVIVSLMFGVASVVLLEVAVSFLGLGLEGSWGTMIAEGLSVGAERSRWSANLSLWAGGALAATVAAAYLLADAVGEAIDARVATTSRTM